MDPSFDPSMDDPMSEEEDEDEGGHPVARDDSDDAHSKGVVLEGEEIAEEDVYAYGDPDDPLDRVLDVYLSQELEDRLYLLQYPMRPADRALNTPHSAKVKVKNHLLEVEHAIKPGGKHFDNHAPPQLRQATQKHTGSRVRPATNFAFAVVRNNEFHITPVHATMQMRPCFDHIDAAKALEIEMDLDDPDKGGAKAQEKPQQVSFKKKESERATAARKSTFAYKKSVEDAEAWVPLHIYGQNDQAALDEFSRMFVDDDYVMSKQGTTAKEFPVPERYLQGLDYMEEYDENGESFSAEGVGRSTSAIIDLAAPGASTYSPVKIPAAPLHQLGGDAKILGYLKLAHLVPFSVLLDVTNMPAEAVLRALSADGRRRGLLVRGNWAARAADVYPKGPPHAADCLSVAQYLLHRYGAVSRPDLQRRFPDLSPMDLKEVLSDIAELDTICRRWVPKVKDGISFGLGYGYIVELEEERWAVQATSLQERLGVDITAEPSCQTFTPFTELLNAAKGIRAEGSVRTRAVNTVSSPAAEPPSYSSAATSAPPFAGGGDAGQDMVADADAPALDEPDLGSPDCVPPRGGGKGKARGDEDAGVGAPGSAAAAAAVAAVGAVVASSAPPRRHFKPKKRPTKTSGGSGGSSGSGSSGGREAVVKQEQEEVQTGASMRVLDEAIELKGEATEAAPGAGEEAATSEGEASSSALGVEEPVGAGGVAASSMAPAKRGRVAGRPRRNAPGVDGGEDSDNVGGRAKEGGDTALQDTRAAAGWDKGKAPVALAKAKEEPREWEAGRGGQAGGEGAVEDCDGGGGQVGGARAGVARTTAKEGEVQPVAGARGKAKEEPAPRPKVRPRPTRAKPKGK